MVYFKFELNYENVLYLDITVFPYLSVIVVKVSVRVKVTSLEVKILITQN